MQITSHWHLVRRSTARHRKTPWGFPFLFIMIGGVGIGVVGTLWSLRKVGILRYL